MDDTSNGKDKYLLEDQDLLEKLPSDPGGSTIQDYQFRATKLLFKATLRNRKSLEDFSKSTSKYSKVLLFFTAVLMAVGILQLVVAITPQPQEWWEQVIVLGTVFGLILLVEYLVIKWLKDDV